MKYIYKAAWALIGGISLQEENDPIELASSENTQFILTRNPDQFLARVDEAAAIGGLMLNGPGIAVPNFQAFLDLEIEKIRMERRKKAEANTVLLFKAQGDIEEKINESMREFDNFIVTFDTFDFDTFKNSDALQSHKSDIEAMKVALAFESTTPSRFVYLSSGVYLLNDSDKVVHSISFSMSAELYSHTPIDEEMARRISARYIALSQDKDVASVERLCSQMSDYDTNPFKAFLSGWTALEILINKSFKSYEQNFLSPFANADQSTLRERFLDRIKEVMKDKYRLTDKFIAVTAVLFPNIDKDESDKNLSVFNKLKKIRDSIFHGESFPENDLPIHELSALLRKYLLARITTSTDAPTDK